MGNGAYGHRPHTLYPIAHTPVPHTPCAPIVHRPHGPMAYTPCTPYPLYTIAPLPITPAPHWVMGHMANGGNGVQGVWATWAMGSMGNVETGQRCTNLDLLVIGQNMFTTARFNMCIDAMKKNSNALMLELVTRSISK